MPFSGEFINSYTCQEIEICVVSTLRFVVEVDKKSVNYSKRLMKYSDIRHSDGSRGLQLQETNNHTVLVISLKID